MPKLLHIESAIADESSRTRAISGEFVRAWQGRGEEYEVVTRDLAVAPLPHLTQRAQHWPERLRGGESLAPETDALQQEVIAELLEADLLLIGAPMYNYAMPSTLKTWIDLIHLPTVTAPFDSDTQPLRGRVAVIVTAQGAQYEPGVEQFVTAPIAQLLGSNLGMEVHVISTSRTLADMIPELGVEDAEAEFASARSAAFALGATMLGK